MKRKLFKWTIKIVAFIVVTLGLLVFVALTPSLMYANKSRIGTFTVYHNEPLSDDLKLRLDDAMDILKTSEYHDQKIKFKICMNDGSLYPSFMQFFLGQAFALGYTSNIVTLCGHVNTEDNYVEVNGYTWNMTQLLAHEQTHCFVFNKFGFWNSNPITHYPTWKWEGYPEYISRNTPEQKDLVKNIEILNHEIKENKDDWGISFSDSTVTSKKYFHYRLLIQYCLDIKKQRYEDLLQDTTSEQTINTQMMNWFATQKKQY